MQAAKSTVVRKQQAGQQQRNYFFIVRFQSLSVRFSLLYYTFVSFAIHFEKTE
ncbi:MAG: hypothetical protein ACLUFV_01195 [Acutalibacteraceae bacterium]